MTVHSAQIQVFIGANQVSTPFTGTVLDEEWPPVDMVNMKPWVCCGFNNIQSDCDIPNETLAAIMLTEAELRSVMVEVSEALARRTRCCWKLGYLGPIMLVIWWLDMILQQLGFGITQCFCQEPALCEVRTILERHNEKVRSKGCSFGLVQDSAAQGTWGDRVYFQVWLIQLLSQQPPV